MNRILPGREARSRLRRALRPALASVAVIALYAAVAVHGTDIARTGRADALPAAQAGQARPKVAAPTIPLPAEALSSIVPEQRIVLHRNAGTDSTVRVSVGIPFPPGMLRDTRLLRILDARGEEVPAAVQVTLKWHAKDGSVRAVRAQFQTQLSHNEETF